MGDLFGQDPLQQGGGCVPGVLENKLEETLAIHGSGIPARGLGFEPFEVYIGNRVIVHAFFDPFQRKEKNDLFAVGINGYGGPVEPGKPGAEFGLLCIWVGLPYQFTGGGILRRGQEGAKYEQEE